MTWHRRASTGLALGLLLSACAAGGADDAGGGALSTGATAISTTSTTTPAASSTDRAPAAPSTDPPSTTSTTERSPEPLRTPMAATEPRELATQIVEAEAEIRDPDTPPDVLANAGLMQQVAYRALGTHPEWDAIVLQSVPEDLRPAVLLNVGARRQFRGMHTRLQENLPAWTIVEPVPAAELLRSYQEAEAEFGIEWEYLAAINLVETGMGRIRGTSSAGAQGPMQFLPSTWDAFGEGDINDPRDAIFGAARYLRHNGGADGNIAGALFRYNNHQNYVRGVTSYALVMKEDPQAFFGFHQWQVVFLTVRGDVILFPGYAEPAPVPVDEYLARS
ncbi:MAG TPA: transglycosylase SLT domain-containing protein [Acidimicrobiales bacterium]|nr:transglycosylase SLT domain-containing protein [Acidimicrobiales bacterium]